MPTYVGPMGRAEYSGGGLPHTRTRRGALAEVGAFERVVAHAEWARKRGRAPSMPLFHVKNPRKALEWAKRNVYFPIGGRYMVGGMPDRYRCDGCKAHGVKLWRAPHNTDLTCAACIGVAVDADGRAPLEPIGDISFHGQMSDQIRGYLPAVPLEPVSGVWGFWGYSSVPQCAVVWWRALPAAKGVG